MEEKKSISSNGASTQTHREIEPNGTINPVDGFNEVAEFASHRYDERGRNRTRGVVRRRPGEFLISPRLVPSLGASFLFFFFLGINKPCRAGE